MKNKILVLSILLALLFVLGCAKKEISSAGNTFQPDARIAALGKPTYKEVSANGFKILPFPGLEYNGIRDGKQAFYAANKDYTFAIYTDPGVTESSKTLDEVIEYYKSYYASYNPVCEEISTVGWITEAKAFSCRYYIESINAYYKSTIFYRDGDYVQTIVGVWGTSLKEYEYIFDAFNAQAVKWD
jgi:hypothetical protein